MNQLDLFSGIGGFHLAGEMVWGDKFNTVVHVEIDPFCQKVLKKHWPNVPIISDIRDVTYEKILAYTKRTNEPSRGIGDKSINKKKENRQTIKLRSSGEGGNARPWAPKNKNKPNTIINLLTGGFPCQPFSCAGKQRSEKDDRYLWPEMLRVISEVRPTWIIGENVAGIINLALDQVLSDLENEGYTCQPFIIPACAKDAPHRRDRVWIVGRAKEQPCAIAKNRDGGRIARKVDGKAQGQKELRPIPTDLCSNDEQDVADTENANRGRTDGKKNTGRRDQEAGGQGKPDRGVQHWLPESQMGGMVDGLSSWMDEPDTPRVATGIKDRVNRLKALGNAIVPQVVVPIMEAIKKIEEIKCHEI